MFSFTVRYPRTPLTKHHHFGHKGGPDANWAFALPCKASTFAIKDQERSKRISEGSSATLREVMTDGSFQSSKRSLMKRPEYFYGDSIPDSSKGFDGKYKWLRVVDGRNMFIPDMDRMYPLIYMQPLSITRSMPWNLTGTVGGVMTGHIVNRNARPAGPQVISGLNPGLYRPEFPIGETPASGGAFIHQFKLAGGNYPASYF